MVASPARSRRPRIPPRVVVRSAWAIHRAVYRLSGGRRGLTRPRLGRYGMLRLRTIGRRTGEERAAIVAYYLDGASCVVVAMNGWAEPHPAWLLNLRAEPLAAVDTVDGARAVVAREPEGAERERLWVGYRAYSPPGDELDDYQTLRATPAVVVVLDPAPGVPDRGADAGGR
ncbi:nitroreductase/quinone reductase family protein [Pseudolysinimonas sp.]|jgi:deazaflavin-dependent oxidoreductase (nitroreductase family)